MWEIVQLRADWPGLSGSEWQLSVSIADLSSQAPRFVREGKAAEAALRAFKKRSAAISSPESIAATFGQWRQAQSLWRAHTSAFRSASSVSSAIGENLISVAHRIGATYDIYERFEAEVIGISGRKPSELRLAHENVRLRREKNWARETYLDHYDEVLRRRPGYGELAQVRKQDGDLPVPHEVVGGENSRYYSAVEIEFWLRMLQQGQAWKRHIDTAMAWHSIAGELDGLSRRIYGHAIEMDRFWQSRSSAAAQESLRLIEGSTRSLANFSGTLAYAVDASAAALQETLEGLRLGWIGRSSAVRDAFDELNSRYAEVIELYPYTLPFILPFGGLVLPEPPGLVRPMPAPPPEGEVPPPADSGQPGHEDFPFGVIGGNVPPPSGTSWDADEGFFDPGEGAPAVIG
jgi:hypothetical protein